MSSIDPRYMKQLLQAQLKPNLDGLSAASSSNNDEFDFAGLLESIRMGLSEDQPASSASAASSTKLSATGSTLPPLGLNRLSTTLLSLQSQPPGSSYDELVKQASLKYGVDAGLVHSVIGAESGYRSSVVSSAGAKGLMQLMDGTAKQMGVTDSFDPSQNIDGGTRYLASLLKRYNGNEGMALAAYNAGPGRVDALGARNDEQLKEKMGQLPIETQKYVASIMARRSQVGNIGQVF